MASIDIAFFFVILSENGRTIPVRVEEGPNGVVCVSPR